MKQTLIQLFITLISVYLIALISAISGYYFLKSSVYIDPLSENGVALNTLLLFFIIGSIPLSLAIFNRQTKKWALLEDKNLRISSYKNAGIIRILIIGFSLVLGIAFYYIMNSQSMLFSAAMAAVALIFCIPTKAKISTELDLEDINN